MTSGERLRHLETAEQYLVGDGDPNGVENAAEGTAYWDYTNDDLYYNTDGTTTWQFIGGSTGLFTAQDVSNVSNPPTDAELDAAFGTPATLGRGFMATVDDNDADTDVWLVWTTDASWYYVKGTKAV